MFFEDSSNGLCRDRVRDNGIDVVGSLNSISNLAYSDLYNSSIFSSGGKLGIG